MDLDKFAAGPERLLGLIKRKGPRTALQLAKDLEISHEAVRQQLGRLRGESLVTTESTIAGRGRPSHEWALTPQGHARFPNAHAQLTVSLIEAVRCELGDEALERIVMARERQSRAAYAAELDGAAGLAERVARLAALRASEGYMAEWRAEADGGFLLIENHCPICAAAAACQGFCRAELEVFQEVLGPGAAVERTDHILAGARRCAYRISPTPPL
jgi:predicted ArsR family transcriptional regulator